MSEDEADQWALLAMEECAEVQQTLSKIIRFGIGSTYKGESNYDRLGFEVKDLLYCLYQLEDAGYLEYITRADVEVHADEKRKRREARHGEPA